jgi:hypothetical protein
MSHACSARRPVRIVVLPNQLKVLGESWREIAAGSRGRRGCATPLPSFRRETPLRPLSIRPAGICPPPMRLGQCRFHEFCGPNGEKPVHGAASAEAGNHANAQVGYAIIGVPRRTTAPM